MADTTLAQSKDDISAREIRKQTRIGGIVPANLEEAYTMALALHKSGLFPDLENAQQALTKIIAGAELGMSPMASLNGFHIVKGKIMTHYSVIAWRVRQAGFKYKVTDNSSERCAIEFFDPSGEWLGESEFTHSDAVNAGVGADGSNGGKGMLKKFPKTMLYARAMSNGARMFVPEAFNGLVIYSTDERQHFEEAVEQDEPTGGTSQRIAGKIVDGQAPDEFDPFHKDIPIDAEFTEHEQPNLELQGDE